MVWGSLVFSEGLSWVMLRQRMLMMLVLRREVDKEVERIPFGGGEGSRWLRQEVSRVCGLKMSVREGGCVLEILVEGKIESLSLL